MNTLKIGDRIVVKASKVLGTPEVGGTIQKVCDDHYIVHCDGDEPEWNGPVAHDGTVLVNHPSGKFVRAE